MLAVVGCVWLTDQTPAFQVESALFAKAHSLRQRGSRFRTLLCSDPTAWQAEERASIFSKLSSLGTDHVMRKRNCVEVGSALTGCKRASRLPGRKSRAAFDLCSKMPLQPPCLRVHSAHKVHAPTHAIDTLRTRLEMARGDSAPRSESISRHSRPPSPFNTLAPKPQQGQHTNAPPQTHSDPLTHSKDHCSSMIASCLL